MSSGRKPMSVPRIKVLRAKGLKYAEIGRLLADEELRSVPYQGESCREAVRLWNLRQQEKQNAVSPENS